MGSNIVSSFDEAAQFVSRPSILAIGSFDGVHRAHQALLRQVVAEAHRLDAQPVVMTFDPHPREVIRGAVDRYYLGRLSERLERIGAAGIETLIVHPFNNDVRQTRAAEFVRQMVEALQLRQLWGGNFTLGYQREGDFDFLSRAGADNNFTVHRFPAVEDEVGRVSSTRIRNSLREGNVRDAAACLGRAYRLTGPIVLGKQLGRTIGVPTANVQAWEKQLLPAHGVYATRIWIDGEVHMAATNVGVRPTVDGDMRVSVEAHVLDFAADLYGKTVQLDFVDRIRSEQKFNGLDALKAQIAQDVEQVRGVLAAS